MNRLGTVTEVDPDAVTGRHPALELAGGHPETWPSVMRAAICSSGAVAIAWHTPGVAGYGLGVLLAVGAPALARALLMPLLALLLRK